MNDVLCDIAARKLPVQPPIDEHISVEWLIGTPIEKCSPVDICRRAIRRGWSHPLTFSMRSIATHPGFDLGDLPSQSALYPLFCVCKISRTLVLQPNLNNAV